MRVAGRRGLRRQSWDGRERKEGARRERGGGRGGWVGEGGTLGYRCGHGVGVVEGGLRGEHADDMKEGVEG